MTTRPLLPDTEPIRHVDRESVREQAAGAIVATDDPELIREWARHHSAEPATGEATESGPATINVQDGGVGVRFNFPAAARFRPISWEEWFQNFQQHDLLFVYERDCADASPSGRYRLVPRNRLEREGK